MSPRNKAAEVRRCTESMRGLLSGYRSLMADALGAEGLTLAQLRMLRAVQQNTGVSAAMIARRCQVTPQTLQAILRRAEREGWIVRGTSERNHRILTASLTSTGAAILERGLEMAARIETMLWKGVPVGALTQLNDVLELGVRNLERELGQEKAPATQSGASRGVR